MFTESMSVSNNGSFPKSKRDLKSRTSFREHAISKYKDRPRKCHIERAQLDSCLQSSVITIVVGQDKRIFGAQEDILCSSAFFRNLCREKHKETPLKLISLPHEDAEIFSSVLEYLYTGDYYPRLIRNKQENSWELETNGNMIDGMKLNLFHHHTNGELLRDTVIYCQAEKYGLEGLKRLALKKQGLNSATECSTVLNSAQYAYAHTPDSDSKLRAHYLALIIRSRSIFKRSPAMQKQMYAGGSQLFFDLFVALSNHADDIAKSP